MATGTTIINFGTTPLMEKSVNVTGQTGITDGAHCEAWVMGDSTDDNDDIDHSFAGVSLTLTCTDILAGVGFTIKGVCLAGALTGDISVRWVWSNA